MLRFIYCMVWIMEIYAIIAVQSSIGKQNLKTPKEIMRQQ